MHTQPHITSGPRRGSFVQVFKEQVAAEVYMNLTCSHEIQRHEVVPSFLNPSCDKTSEISFLFCSKTGGISCSFRLNSVPILNQKF